MLDLGVTFIQSVRHKRTMDYSCEEEYLLHWAELLADFSNAQGGFCLTGGLHVVSDHTQKS